MASNMFLYWGSGSVPCWRAMIALEEKGLQGYGQKLISFSDKEHKGPEVLKLNPRGKVPTFRDGQTVVNESGAICDYLEYKFSSQGQRLLPEDPVLRAKVLQRVHEAQNMNRSLMEGVLSYFFRTKPEDRDEALMNTKKAEAKEELQRWEAYMEKEGPGAYVAGKDFTMADIFVFPILAFGVRNQLNLDSYPCLKAYYDRVVTRPSITASWPPHWKETQGKEIFNGV